MQNSVDKFVIDDARREVVSGKIENIYFIFNKTNLKVIKILKGFDKIYVDKTFPLL